jgi:hypothetical protein
LLALTLFLVGMCWCLLTASTAERPTTPPARGGSDLRLYRRIVERVHAGDNYYDAAGQELREQGYPTGSLFNWRTPLYALLIGSLSSITWGQVFLGCAALITLLLTYAVVERDGGMQQAVATVLLLLGAFMWCVDGDAFLSQELWAGVLIALSVCAYAQGRWPLGFAVGLSALFLRELSLPYCLLALLPAWRQKRRAEAVLWLAGLALYSLYLFGHGLEVTRRLTPADRLPPSWIQFGGTAFLLSTCRMNAFLFALPAWVSAIYLPLAILGLAGWRGATGLRVGLTVAGYLAAFAVVGQPFNNYWGLLYAPLLPFGIVRAPAALRDLCMAIHPVRSQNEG